jgi:hypothetical protein
MKIGFLGSRLPVSFLRSLLRKEQNVQVSDTTKAHSSTKAENTNSILQQQRATLFNKNHSPGDCASLF